MKKFEYAISKIIPRLLNVREFNDQGDQGWELVSVVPTLSSAGHTIGYQCIYKREITEQKEAKRQDHPDFKVTDL